MADLANLSLSEEEVHRFQADLNEILGHIEKLKDIDTAGVEPMAQVLLRSGGHGNFARGPGAPGHSVGRNSRWPMRHRPRQDTLCVPKVAWSAEPLSSRRIFRLSLSERSGKDYWRIASARWNWLVKRAGCFCRRRKIPPPMRISIFRPNVRWSRRLAWTCKLPVAKIRVLWPGCPSP